jgi:alkanesulfonate monooxygenase SsuD/methylene tetrahydromethanopterin reductase-like flavin-dependent oxidoreductase (luciferase family)
MDLSVMLPTGTPGVTGADVVEWARRADEGPYRSLAVPDRVAYANLDPMLALAAAAAVTRRVRLMTYVALGGVRNPAVFAKEVATLSVLAPGRVTIGLGIGARPADYEACGLAFGDRGRLLDRALEKLVALRERPHPEQGLGPDLGDVELLVGGASPRAMGRLLTHADGYAHGGVIAPIFAAESGAVRAAWAGAGRSGAPRLVASTWFCSGPETRPVADAWLESYMVQGGPPEFVRDTIKCGADAVRESIGTFAAMGADEIVFFPTVSAVDELDWLTSVVDGLPADLTTLAPPDLERRTAEALAALGPPPGPVPAGAPGGA